MPARERLLGFTAVRAGALRVGACVLVLLVPLAGRAQDALTRAERARRDARLEDAQAAYVEALRQGALDFSEVAHAHLRLAELAYLGEELMEGERHLRYALSLRPDAPMDEAPQPMRDAAAAILVARSQRTLRAVIEVGDASAPIGIDVRDAPEGLVRVVEVRGAAGFSRTLAWDGSAREIDVPAEVRPIAIRVLDAHGNVLASAGVLAPSSDAEPEAPMPVEEPVPLEEPLAEEPFVEEPLLDQEESFFESPWLWVIIGVVLVGVGVAVGVSASGDRYVVGAPSIP